MLQMKRQNLSKNFRVPAAAQVIITGVLPYAFLAYYPTLRLLDKMKPPPPLSLAAPRTGRAATAVAARVWRRRLISRPGIRS